MLGADVLTFLAHRAIMFGDTRVPYQRRREAPGLLQRVEQRVHDGRRPRRLRSPRPKHESLQSEPSGYDEVAIRHPMGFEPHVFPVLFAIGRTAGWIAQWEEMLKDPEQKIARPRQVYVGEQQREYIALDKR